MSRVSLLGECNARHCIALLTTHPVTCICLPWFTVLVSGSHWWGIFSWCDLYLFFINHGYSFWIPLMGYDFFVGWMCLFFIHDSIFLLIIDGLFFLIIWCLFFHLWCLFAWCAIFLSLAHLFFLSLVIMTVVIIVISRISAEPCGDKNCSLV